MMSGRDVLAFVDRMNLAQIEFWLDGGWCVDALVGEQTREHDDLDIGVPIEDADAYRATMQAAGFTLCRDDGPYCYVLTDAHDHRVDVHFFDRSTTHINADGREVFGGIAYTVDAFGATGTINGRSVPCCTPEFTMYAHTGYEPDADDVADMRVLHERLGTPLLPPFTPR
jgi:lincosamide nucleotidyltransferase A/C/D/E